MALWARSFVAGLHQILMKRRNLPSSIESLQMHSFPQGAVQTRLAVEYYSLATVQVESIMGVPVIILAWP